MNGDDAQSSKSGNVRFVQFLLLISGLAFIAAGVFLLATGGMDPGSRMTLLAAALIVVGFGDLFLAFFIFRRDKRGGGSGDDGLLNSH
jgi:uncharacterized membrane protein HdeD (DUF308 family)